MIFPSLKSALQSFSASTLGFNWKKIYCSFPPSRVVLSTRVAQPPFLIPCVSLSSPQEPDSSDTLAHETRALVPSVTSERCDCHSNRKAYWGGSYSLTPELPHKLI